MNLNDIKELGVLYTSLNDDKIARVFAYMESMERAEKDKNTEYSFLYQFVFVLRNCSKKEFMLSSPFSEIIDLKFGNKKH